MKIIDLVEKEEFPSVKTLTPRAIAELHSTTLTDINQQLEMGIKVETEHTSDKKKAREIALDHLKEDPKYYTHLADMEDKFK